jgi:SAM-dependent methyltransferase
MNDKTAKILYEINNDFYRNNCASFSATREAPWPGWQQCGNLLAPEFKGHKALSILDLASGNLRFEKFFGPMLAREKANMNITFYAVDNCDDLLPPDAVDTKEYSLHYQNLDILDALLSDLRLNDSLTAPRCDLSVSFGFMHHVPGQAFRQKVLDALIEATKSGGFIIVSFWQFYKNATLKQKAEASHALALKKLALPPLDDGDYLLGWKDLPDQFRYCHSFFDYEIDDLIESTIDRATLVSRFAADGRSDDLNTYIALKVL